MIKFGLHFISLTNMLKLLYAIFRVLSLSVIALFLLIFKSILDTLLIIKSFILKHKDKKPMLPLDINHAMQETPPAPQAVMIQKNNHGEQKPPFESYYPATDVQAVPPHIIASYRHKVPSRLIDIWQTTGFGKYGDGLIEFINPQDYEENLWRWLDSEQENYTPFAINAFGDMFYYRRLSDVGDEDVCLLDIQYRKCEVLDWDFDDFLDETLTDDDFRQEWLRLDLFLSAQKRHGNLQNGEVYMFTPIIALGNPANNVELLDKGLAVVYQMLVLEMGKDMYQ